MASETGLGARKALLLGGLVVVATCGAILLFGGGAAAEAPSDEPVVVEEEVLEVHPLVPEGAIKSASWHKAGAEPEHGHDPDAAGATTSLIEASGLGKDDEKDERARKSLEEVVRKVNGLGVYVAPAEEEGRDKRRKD
jgi:hypothetical protein